MDLKNSGGNVSRDLPTDTVGSWNCTFILATCRTATEEAYLLEIFGVDKNVSETKKCQ